MLSQENINKLHINGLYKCEPVLSWLPDYKRDNPYWCRNWTFKVRQSSSGKYFMYDTYWSTGDNYPVELSDENFDKFEFLFDLDDIKYVNSYDEWLKYPEDERWRVALDSGGYSYAKYVVKKDATKIKEKVIDKLRRDIEYIKQDLAYKESILDGIINGNIDHNYW